MKKELKDYLYLYVGCDCNLMGQSKSKDEEGYSDEPIPKIFTISGVVDVNGTMFAHCDDDEYHHEVELSEVFPILRPISDMSEQERKEIYEIVFKRKFPVSGRIVFMPDTSTFSDPRWILSAGVDRLGIEVSGSVWADCDLQTIKYNENLVTVYMLKKGFDLFGLIESELAIDKTKQLVP